MPTFDDSAAPLRIAYILAGGKSSRFGSNKAHVLIDGKPQIQRLSHGLVADAWQPYAISGHRAEFDLLGIQTVRDIEPDQGPVAGILSGMLHHRAMGGSVTPWVLFLSCDLWKWNPVWSRLLVPVMDNPDSKTGVFRYFEGKDFLPLPCLIHQSALPEIQNAWDRENRSLRQLVRSFGLGAVSVAVELDQLPESFNTLAELRRLQGG